MKTLLTAVGTTVALMWQISAHAEDALPEPLPEWEGTIGVTLDQSTPYFLPEKHAPEGAPNVLLIMLDDTGFSHMSAFGGPIQTPAFDRIANEGLRYTHMTTTATCSPTRAALLTGRNHHAVGAGIITEMSSAYPGYNNRMDDSTTSLARILTLNGYSTAAFGKWHNTPAEETSYIGPFDNWPTGRWGFEYFYGFQGGETNQFHPLLVENTTLIDTPETNADGSPYHLSEDLADQAIRWLDNWRTLRDQPFFMYWAPGAVHAPIQVPESWRDRYDGVFDEGWDAYREQTFARQKALGLFPEDAQLPDRPDTIPEWDSYSQEERDFLTRQMEVTAAFVEHADHQVGRVLSHLESMGQLDNTLVIYLNSDNGASSEGTLSGSFSELLMQNSFPPLSMEEQMEVLERYGGLDAWGGPELNNHYPAAWAWAGSTPYPWVKQVAGYLGTSAATAIRYPSLITDQGGIRHQFQHVTDIVPTILEVTGVQMPDRVNGLRQTQLDGASMVSSFSADATAISAHPTQYFEMLGFHGIYHDGWMASAVPYRVPWTVDPNALANFDPPSAAWELYNLAGGDLTQSQNVAEQNPKRLAQLKAIFDDEAQRNNVYPIGGSLTPTLQPEATYALRVKRSSWVMNANNYRIAEAAGPKLTSGNFSVTADVETSGKDVDGVIFAVGDQMGGMSLYIKDGRLKFRYSMLGWHLYDAVSDTPVPSGRFTVGLTHTMLDDSYAGPARVVLTINGAQVGSVVLEDTVPLTFTAHEPFDVGRDSGAPVTPDYAQEGLFKFSGTIHSVRFENEDSAAAGE